MKAKEEYTSIVGVKVKAAFLHQTITWPGVMGSEKSLNSSRVKGLKMTHNAEGLILECKGQRAFVPNANVANSVLEET